MVRCWVAALSVVVITGCGGERPPLSDAEQLMAHCKMDAALAAGHAPLGIDRPMPTRLVACMKAKGFDVTEQSPFCRAQDYHLADVHCYHRSKRLISN